AVEGQHVALCQPAPRESRRRAPHRVEQLCVSQRAPRLPFDNCGLVREPLDLTEDQAVERHVGDWHVGERASENHRWSMVNGQWSMVVERLSSRAMNAQALRRSTTIHHLPFTIYYLMR